MSDASEILFQHMTLREAAAFWHARANDAGGDAGARESMLRMGDWLLELVVVREVVYDMKAACARAEGARGLWE